MAFIETWDETKPSGLRDKSLGDDDIREFKRAIRERLAVDHVFLDTESGNDIGKHKQLSLIEAADIGTGATGLPILGAQTAAGKPELVFTDEDNNDVQITKAGKLNAAALDTGYTATILAVAYPIGSLYITTISTNPATVLGFGTWVAFAEGQVLVGKAAAGTFVTAGAQGGAETVTLTAAESGLPAHTHSVAARNAGGTQSGADAYSIGGSINTGSTGGSAAVSAHNNLQPYIVVYMFKRTA